MKFSEYCNSRQNVETSRVRFYVPLQMQSIFNISSHIDLKGVIGLRCILPKYCVFTRDMLEYLGVQNLTQHVLDMNVLDIVDITSHINSPDINHIKNNMSQSWLNVFKAQVVYQYRRSGDPGNNDKCAEFERLALEWKTIVLDPLVDAFIEKLELPSFSDDDSSDESGVDDLVDFEEYNDYEDDVFVVCNNAKPVGVFSTRHKARKYIKSVHKRLWTSVIRESINEPHYTISVCTMDDNI